MRVILKPGALALAPETPQDEAALAAWRAKGSDHVFHVDAAQGGVLRDLGVRAEACREPINITSRSPRPHHLISNFAETPFDLDGWRYASIEGFWQGLKFPDEADRLRLASLSGGAAKDAGSAAPAGDLILYGNELIRVGTWDHWQLMSQACYAKFSQHAPARAALLATGARPLTHNSSRDSKTIPGVIMAGIWMDLRARMGGAALR